MNILTCVKIEIPKIVNKGHPIEYVNIHPDILNVYTVSTLFKACLFFISRFNCLFLMFYFRPRPSQEHYGGSEQWEY